VKALLLSTPKVGRFSQDEERFYLLIKALSQCGIYGRHYPLYTKNQLQIILQTERPDIVYCADYYTTEDNGTHLSIHALLDEYQIPYIGSSPDTLELVLSKSDLKAKWWLNNVSTPPYFPVQNISNQVLVSDGYSTLSDYPYILKPDREGNSRGLDESSIVFDQKSLEVKLDDLLKLYKEILIEKYLGNYSDIREFTVAMIGNGHHKLLMPAEITLKQKKLLRIITTEDKETHKTQALAVKDMELSRKLTSLAEQAFEVAGVRDYARCDLILADGHLYAIEINGQPMIPDKWFEVCASGIGLDPTQYINAIFLAGLVRNIKDAHSELIIPKEMMEKLPMQILDPILK